MKGLSALRMAVIIGLLLVVSSFESGCDSGQSDTLDAGTDSSVRDSSVRDSSVRDSSVDSSVRDSSVRDSGHDADMVLDSGRDAGGESVPDAADAGGPEAIQGLVYRLGQEYDFTADGTRLVVPHQPAHAVSRFHLFVVAKHDNLQSSEGDNRFFFSAKRSGNDQTIGLRSQHASGAFGSVIRLDGQETSPRVIESMNHADQLPHIHEVYFDGAQYEYSIDSHSQGVESVSGQIDTDNATAITIGNHSEVDSSAEGVIYEVLLYNRRLNATESAQVRAWLEQFVTLPATKHGPPVLARTGDEQGFKSPCIAELNASQWVLLHGVRDSSGWKGITYATSPKSDPHNWTKSGEIILTRSPSGWDSNSVSDVWALKEADGWKVLYADRAAGAIGLATGPDLQNLVKHPGNPILSGTSGWETFVRYPTFHKIGGVYHLYYDGRADHPAGSIGDIGHATSTDLVNWTRDPANPVITSNLAQNDWAKDDVGQPAIVSHNGALYLAYHGYNKDLPSIDYPHQIGMARYDAVLGWQPLQNPILSWSYGGWDVVNASEPLLWSLNGELILYYMGKADTGGSGGDFGRARVESWALVP